MKKLLKVRNSFRQFLIISLIVLRAGRPVTVVVGPVSVVVGPVSVVVGRNIIIVHRVFCRIFTLISLHF